ncbi:tRNA (N6-isopentenyl adenosine(37)-C2)-methylthiotransferase MiaB [Youxingia wuxianensis]|uniref:tRNA-2-methylthio-N(6)-dimethylallyladenosine synthase n=1 Tax=Youxingia wuxianensis TaxID=2763678 RepID=A0A926EN72_9FIRM|nr:tRNA (N6-isopentenyl adenosine(37)-C2)-methylthiotransferase MiaB [Youxingia wuxianensis]MBC8584327.1 tRNA (N6-isopentenyl adenosine(37)-C2)-methylthiotransferase MiaB [Youxingia wuxianensis]
MSQTKWEIISEDILETQQKYAEKTRELLIKRYPRPLLAYVHSFGCQQNVSDGEKIMGMLYEMGYGFTDTVENADLVIYNTCAVRENAHFRVFGHVGALKPIKEQRPDMIIGLCGCMMQQSAVADKIKKSYPYVDIVFGTHAMHTLPQLLYQRLTGSKRMFSIENSDGSIVEGLPVKRIGSVKASLPIMYGCDNFCTYCVVPYVRGRERSRKPQDILCEVKKLVAEGYREITLLGQNVNSYGKGLEEEIDFSDLLSQINAVEGDFQIRFMTSHPKDCTKKLIDTIAACQKVCNHIHLPVQSGNNRVLKEMNRKYTVEDYLALIDYARKTIPGITFSSDIIVGFPGETYEEFLDTLALIKKVRYTALFTFIYSPREGTKAAKMEDPVPEEEKSKWLRQLLTEQSNIRQEMQEALIGKKLRVLAEGKGKSGDGYLTGRNVSGDIVEFSGEENLIGSFVDVQVEKALNWAVFGKLV